LKSVYLKIKKNTIFSLVTVGIGGLYMDYLVILLINAAITENCNHCAIIGTVVIGPILILTSSATIMALLD
jgi:hypothetical protein